ncbi:TPA: hypothetical protein QIB97_000449 [Proteus mirabilis]|nr:hypothetical protein [Proteus mirabilis]
MRNEFLSHSPAVVPFCTDVHRSYQYDSAYNVVGIEDDRWRQTRYHYNANDQITETQYSPQWGNQDKSSSMITTSISRST